MMLRPGQEIAAGAKKGKAAFAAVWPGNAGSFPESQDQSMVKDVNFSWKVLRSAESRFLLWKAGLLAVAALAAAGCSHPTNQKTIQTQQNSGLTVTMTTVPSPPHSGDDTIDLDVTTTATGLPLEGANITATADMLAPKIAGSQVSGRSRGNGRYEVPVRLGIAAKYDVHVQIVQQGQAPVDFVFPIEAWQ
jgi:hypothetical protein